MAQMTLITGVTRRRRWSMEDRRRILAAVAEPGAVVFEVARRADICTSLIYKWRREERATAVCGFVAATVVEAPGGAPPVHDPAAVTIELGGTRLKIGSMAPAGLVTAILRALR